jgi:putative nucleotidyltransferase with HDIG domain
MMKINPLIPRTKGAYIVGGSIRDLVLGKTPADYDIAVLRFPEKYASDLSSCVNGQVVRIGKNNQMIYRVISENNCFDISAIEGGSIEDDLARRDFTLNAISYDLSSGKITDLFGGLNDISIKKIRMVSKDVFKKDPVRLIRAYRIAAMLSFEIEPETLGAIIDNLKLTATAAGERIKAELFKILSCQKAYSYIRQMCETGLLLEIFPELNSLRGCRQNNYHAYDVLDHSLAAFGMLEKILNNEEPITGSINFPVPEMSKERSALLKYSILLHDIGKPATLTIGNDGNIHFLSHEVKGAEMAKQISKRLRLSNKETDYVDFIIRNHILALNLFNSCNNISPSKKSLTRFFIKCRENTPDILLHTIADIIGKGIDDERNGHFVSFASYLLNEFFSDYEIKKTGPRLITGEDLINECGLSPSPLFKRILSDVEESRISNEIKNRKEAILLAKELIKKYSGEWVDPDP